ncbi:hexaprenyldihydroxybenzoate methyltransferase [Crucibulum laeve]|uniref:Hexaprenyldihydroxybenzoate methyltransferase n=1 Tax=Crucibulum laeve TaxID=68775 RepID=A0A5C3M1N2_9AGAR|nr:hexaprenyldihydroxybenzoate methyltransferase [Crucibulum laeve]
MTVNPEHDLPTEINVNYTLANQKHFDQSAQTYDSPQAIELARRSARAMRRVYEFDENTTCVMDFACGTGLISHQLAPYAQTIVGVDISQRMVDRYNEQVGNQGISHDEMQAICADLQGVEGELDGMKFDIVVCASSYHHFDSISSITRTLAYFLKPGGTLLVIDLLKAEHLDLDALFPDHLHHLVAHKGGFREEELRKAFDDGGLKGFEFSDAVNVKKKGEDLKLFIAKGLRQ